MLSYRASIRCWRFVRLSKDGKGEKKFRNKRVGDHLPNLSQEANKRFGDQSVNGVSEVR